MTNRVQVLLAVYIIMIVSACNRDLVQTTVMPVEKEGYDTADYNIIFNDALRQKMLGNASNALRLFDRALRVNPNSDASFYEMSLLFRSAGDLRSAVSYAVRAEELDRNNHWYVHNAGMQYYMAGRYDSAAYYFEKLVELKPEREDYKLSLEGLYEQAGRFDEARDIINQFIDKYGEEQELLVALVRIYNMWGKSAEAENAIIRLINTDADKTVSYGLLAEFFKQENREQEAAEIYRRLIEYDSNNPELILSYIDFLRVYRRYQEFFNELSAVVINDSISVEGKLRLFSSILQDSVLLEQRTDDIELITLLLSSNYPDIPEIALLSAQIFESIGRAERAAGVLRKYCERDPGNYPMWERLLFVYNSAGNTEDLYAAAKYVATKFNLYPLPKLLYAFAASEKGEFDLALRELDKALTLAGNQEELLIEITSLLANIYYEKGDYERSFKTFAKGLELSPDNPLLLNNYAYYLAEQDLELKEALKMIEHCLKTESNSTYLDTYAWVLYKLGKYRKAKGIMEALEKNKAMESADHYEHFGYIEKALDNCENAIVMWERAKEMDNEKTYLDKEIEQCQK